MEQNKLFNDLFAFMKTSYETTLKSMEMMQGQAEKTLNIMLDQSVSVQGEGKKAVKDWIEYGKKIRDEYKKQSEDYMKKMESYFEGAAKEKGAK